jgi:acetate kinase
MATQGTQRLLTINTGSSSLKAALYAMGSAETREYTFQAKRIGRTDGQVNVTDTNGAAVLEQRRDLPNHAAALQALWEWLRRQQLDAAVSAVGHRVVHGGERYRGPQLIDDALIAALQGLVAIDPEHLPQALGAIEATRRVYPAIPQVACFDTAFHRHMPQVAQRYALPRRLWDAGVRRYGFHGLSYEFILSALHAENPAAANGRLIIAHLGNGASMAAVRGGVGIDTTMGFTPTGGLVMGTRCGDLDPGVLIYLLQVQGMSADDVKVLLNKHSGLLGVSDLSPDMRDLLDQEVTDPRAAAAIELFCYQARKFLGALAVVLGGLETLIFTGGIGEHAAPIRWRICAGLEFLGIQLDAQRNAAHAPVISRDGSPVTVRVMATDEELTIARHTERLILHGGTDHVEV